ncbi:hypothetical protein ATANTOWER_021481, partial [Ataeniobius toweri]|nr:hypothetical protein [Ataeniobius toweri]
SGLAVLSRTMPALFLLSLLMTRSMPCLLCSCQIYPTPCLVTGELVPVHHRATQRHTGQPTIHRAIEGDQLT